MTKKRLGAVHENFCAETICEERFGSGKNALRITRPSYSSVRLNFAFGPGCAPGSRVVELRQASVRPYPSFYDKVVSEVPEEVVDIARIGRSHATICVPVMSPLEIASTRPCDDLILCCLSQPNPRVRWRYDGDRWRESPLRRGQLIVMPSRVCDEWQSEHAYRAIELAIPRQEIERILSEAGIRQSIDFPALTERGFNDAFLAETARKFPSLIRHPGAHDAIFADALVEVVVIALADLALGRSLTRRPVRRLSFAEMRRLSEFAATHLADGISLRDFAALLNMTEFHFSRAFKVTTGQSPHQWLLDRRVDRARLLLASTPRLSGEEIARQCGFADHPHLARVLRRLTGATMSELRSG